MKTLHIALSALILASTAGSAALASDNNYSADRAQFYATLGGANFVQSNGTIDGRQAAPVALSQNDALVLKLTQDRSSDKH